MGAATTGRARDGGIVGESGAAAPLVTVWRPRHLGGVEVVRGSANPHSIPRHFHEELEIGLKQGGGWDFHHRSAWHAVAPGTLVLTPPGDVHMMRSPGGADGSVYNGLRLDASLFRHAAADIAGRSQRAPDFATLLVQDRNAAHLFSPLVAALAEGSTALPLEQDARLLDMLGHLILRHGAARLALRSAGAEPGGVRRARQYLEAHAERPVALAELARVADLNVFYFCRTFGATVGMPPHAYQTQVRVARAKALLIAGHLPLAQVATAVGFASQSHLTRHFARLVGVTPGQYVRAGR